jgi:hypothetical protein
MTREKIQSEYFDWMYNLVNGKPQFQLLLHRLNDIPFTYTIPMDGNRAEDGVELRYRFGYETGYDDRVIASYLDDRDCSVLEMMVALAVRCEEHIMDDPDFGDRTGRWFWDMVTSLGLINMTDRHFNIYYVDTVIDIFLDRQYSRNGEGGLFTVNDRGRDLRSVEIWYQMCWYLGDISNA